MFAPVGRGEVFESVYNFLIFGCYVVNGFVVGDANFGCEIQYFMMRVQTVHVYSVVLSNALLMSNATVIMRNMFVMLCLFNNGFV